MLNGEYLGNYQITEAIEQGIHGIPMGAYEKEVERDRQFFINHLNWLTSEISNY